MRALVLFAFCLASTAQSTFDFDTRRIAGDLESVDGLMVTDVTGDAKPDIVVTARGKIVWFENPDWRARPLAGAKLGYAELPTAASPVGRVNRVRRLALVTSPGSGVEILRQSIETPDPQKGTLREPLVLLDKQWEMEASIEGGVKALAWADFDGDGSDELVLAGKTVRLLDCGPQFEWRESRVAGGVFEAVAAADLNGDGLADLVTADSEGAVDVRLNRSRVPWRRHIIAEGYPNQTVVGADFTGDGKVDVIASSYGGQPNTVLYIAPDWKPVVLQTRSPAIHGEVIDVDGDGDPDYIGARHSPGFIFWLETPADPLEEPWPLHVIDDAKEGGVDGVHGLITGDVDRDGKLDLIANSALPEGAFPNSLAWYKIPPDPRKKWERHVFARGDAPGLSHYHGFGDVNGDGRGDIPSAAKIGDDGNWFAWWEQPADPAATWTKHVISANEPGATNILVTDVNGDGRNDFLASRGHGVGLVWFENPSWNAHQIDTKLIGPHSLAVGDIDGDGDTDAVTCAKDSHIAAWFENDGKGNFATHRIHEDQASYDIRLVDMDGDGDLDVLNAGQESRNVVWFENRLR